MDIQATKLELIKKLLNTTEEAVLAEIWKILEEGQRNDRVLSKEEYDMINERRKRHLNGESPSFSWDEVKQQARRALEE
jgi:hypothetical protein